MINIFYQLHIPGLLISMLSKYSSFLCSYVDQILVSQSKQWIHSKGVIKIIDPIQTAAPFLALHLTQQQQRTLERESEKRSDGGNVLLPDIHIAYVTTIIQSLKEHVERLPCAVFSMSLAGLLFEWPTETQAWRWKIVFT